MRGSHHLLRWDVRQWLTDNACDRVRTILATSHLLQLPTYAFYEDEFAIDIATRGVTQLRHLYEKYMEKIEEESVEGEEKPKSE